MGSAAPPSAKREKTRDMHKHTKLGQLLVSKGMVQEWQFLTAMGARRPGQKLGEIMVERSFLSEEQLFQALISICPAMLAPACSKVLGKSIAHEWNLACSLIDVLTRVVLKLLAKPRISLKDLLLRRYGNLSVVPRGQQQGGNAKEQQRLFVMWRDPPPVKKHSPKHEMGKPVHRGRRHEKQSHRLAAT